MSVSIWQQWASNHSADFTIAGRFESVEAAEKAADELRQVVVEIAQWYHLPENRHIATDIHTELFRPPTPPEVRFAEQYGIEWKNAVDWLVDLFDPNVAVDAVTSYDKIVFLSRHFNQSDLGPAPFDQIMARLGGTVTTEFEAISAIEVMLTCRAPDEMAAEAIFQDCDAYLSGRVSTPPWHKSDVPVEETLSFVRTSASASIVRTDQLLIFRKLEFDLVETGLPALIAYLKEYGCTDIQYELTQT